MIKLKYSKVYDRVCKAIEDTEKQQEKNIKKPLILSRRRFKLTK
jgi:hypothetical protein